MKNDTELAILDVARKQFVKNGFGSTRMQEIANEAGINKAMLHYYFRSKEKLYQEIITQIFSTILPRLAKAIGQKATFWDRLEKIIETYISTLLEQPDIPFFIMSEISQKRESFIAEIKKRSEYFPVVQSFLVQMHQEMELGNIKKMPPIHLFLNIMGMTVFPFISKPIFCTVLDFSDQDFEALMKERKTILMNFIKSALEKD